MWPYRKHLLHLNDLSLLALWEVGIESCWLFPWTVEHWSLRCWIFPWLTLLEKLWQNWCRWIFYFLFQNIELVRVLLIIRLPCHMLYNRMANVAHGYSFRIWTFFPIPSSSFHTLLFSNRNLELLSPNWSISLQLSTIIFTFFSFWSFFVTRLKISVNKTSINILF